MEITNLQSWLLAVIDIRYHNRRFDIFEKRNKAFDLIVEFMIADRLYYKMLTKN